MPPERPPPRLIATLGPASFTLAREIAAAGADAFRLNASHLEPVALHARLAEARSAAPLPVVVDLQGAKIRLGAFAPRGVQQGEELAFALAPDAGELPLPHPELFGTARAGDTLTCHDGRLLFRVEAAARDRISTRCVRGGRLQPRTGINLVEHPVRLPGLTEMDRAAIAAASGAECFAFSFMEDGREAAWIRAAAPDARVAAKVERAEAVAALGQIASRVDEVWICRGDLGAQLGLAEMARFVGRLDPRTPGVPVLMAGQVLQQLVRAPEPSRSEACHLHDLLARGYAGIVLSDETAIGADPAGAVRLARALLREFAG